MQSYNLKRKTGGKSKTILAGLEKNVSLSECTTFKIGGKAKYFFAAKTKSDLIKAVEWAKRNRLPFFILGGGSNILAGDKPFGGLVIKIKNLKLETRNSKLNTAGIYCEAGAPLAKVVRIAAEKGLAGLEWAAGIPGSVGGAIRGNASAFGGEMADAVKEVEAYDSRDGQIKVFSKDQCLFAYKDSIFKREASLIIVSAVLELKPGSKQAVGQKIKEYLEYRRARHPLGLPSAGCIFKNPPGYRAAELIEGAGLKGASIGGAQISEKHANFIVNRGKAKEADVRGLIALAKKMVKEKYGLKLEEEIQMMNLGV